MKTNNNKINMNAGAFVKEAAAKEESIKAASRLVRECPEGRNQFTRVFETADGEKAAVLYPVPVHVKKDGKWEAVDNRLRASEDGKTFENGSAVLKVRLAGNGCDDELAAVEKDGFCLSWGLCREKEVTLASFKASAVVPFEVETTLDAEKQKTMEKNGEETASPVISLAASNLTSGGTYKDILPGVDIRYRLESDVLKEAVILKTKEVANRSLTFTLKHKGLKVLPDGVGGLCFRNEKTDTEVFCMDVPVLEDAHGALLRGSLQVTEKGKGESILLIGWDKDWLDDPERAFPITVDPTVRTPSSSTTITDAYVVSARPDEHLTGTYGEMEVGKNRVNQVCRSFLRFDTLPEIEPASVITKAVLNIYTFNYSADSGLPFMVSAHEVMGGWSSSAVSWNTQPEFESTALDYVYFEPTGNQAIPKSFDVTKLVKKWYNDPSTNHGVALKAVDETTYGYCMVVASDMDPSWYGLPLECLPAGIIYYRSAKGLEDYFSYHSQSLGRTGTGHVNRYNGNLVFVHPDEGTTGVLMPISVSHVYNLADCHTDSRFGKGFRLSLMQELKASGNTDFPYVLIDADGTSHYFYRDTEDENKLKDEDGLGLVITETEGDTFNASMVMEDKNKIRYIFGEDSYLRQIVDLNGNTIEYQYGLNAAGNTLDRAIDPTGAMVEFWYTDGYTRLDHIEANGRFTYFGYDAEGHLTTITYPDGKESHFAYNGDKILYAEDPDGYRITYSYTEDCTVDRVSQIQEGVADNGVITETGTTIRIEYPALGTTVFTEPGLDGQIGTETDNRVFTWKFNRFGTAAEVSDNAGHVSAFEHCTEQENRHRLRQTAFTGKVVDNLLANSGFDSYAEFYDTWSNTTTQANEDDWGMGRMTDRGYFGDTSILVLQETASGHTAVCQTVPGLPAGTYTLSAYAYVGSITPGNGNESGSGTGSLFGCGAALGVKIGNGSITWSDEKLTEPADEDIDRGWRRIRQTFTVPSAQDVTIYGGLTGASGTVWFDCFQLEKGERANRFNLVNNNCFADGDLAGWETEGLESTDGVVNDIGKGKSLLLYGNPEGNKRVSQNIYVSGTEGDVYRFGCFALSEAIPEKEFRLTATVNYTDGSHKSQEVDIDPYRSGWQYVSGILSTDDENSTTSKTYSSLTLSVSYNNQLNPAMFTSMQLMKDDTVSYTYDSKGNLNTAKKTQENNAFQYDGDSLLKRLGAQDGSSYEIGYTTSRQPRFAKSAEGQRSFFWYNDKGQPTTLSIEADRNSTAVTAGRIYYLRQKKTGKYMDACSDESANNNVQQYTFNGTAPEQKWKVENAGEGYMKLLCLKGTGNLALSLQEGSGTEGENLCLAEDDDSHGQKFRLQPLYGGGYQLLSKASEDERCVMVAAGTGANGGFADKVNVQLGTASDTETRSVWYFEPADEGNISAAPKNGKIYRIRTRHSGQYVCPLRVAVGQKVRQGHSYFSNAEKFILTFAENSGGKDWYYLAPTQNTSFGLQLGDADASEIRCLTIQAAGTDDSRKFRFEAVGDGYAIINKTGYMLGVRDASYNQNAWITGDAVPASLTASAVGEHRIFLMEEVSRTYTTSMTYTDDGRNIARTADVRGKYTYYTYDSDNRLLTRVNDPNNHTLDYSYDPDTDQLTGVEADMGGGISRSVAYIYDDAERLKTITHNGTVYSYEYDGFGNQTSVKVGNGSQTASTLEDYEYYPGNGPLKKVTYGNGDVQQIGYDAEERVSSRSWNGTETVRYAYDADGNLEEEKDFAANRTRRNLFDTTGRLVRHYTEAGTGAAGSGETLQVLEVGYDSMNRVESLVQVEGDHKLKTTYLYGKAENQQMPGLSYGLKMDGVTRQELAYDRLGRRTEEHLHLSAENSRSIQYSYGSRNSRISTDPFLIGMDNGSKSYSYTYDNAGNITEIVAGNQTITYAYDACNQLIRENNQVLGKTILYTYDLGGNLTSRTEHAYTTGTPGAATKTDTFIYGNKAWKDQLTAYNGTPITYDGSGNPLQYRGMTFTWQRGRQLQSVTKNGVTTTFQYDAQGRRISKTTGGTTTEYYYNGSTLTALKKGNDLVQFVYDASGRPVFMRVNGVAEYAYLYNGQGDVTRLVDSGNNEVVSYEYDSWGKVVNTTDTSSVGIGSINPFRYRGYVYDMETGLYYLSTRYYDSEVERFICIDQVKISNFNEATLYERNLYVYCDNNPICRTDVEGNCWITTQVIACSVGFVFGILSTAILDINQNIMEGAKGKDIFTRRSSGMDYLAAGIGGAIAAYPVASIKAAVVLGGLGNVVTDAMQGNINDFGDFAFSAVSGGVANGMGASINGAVVNKTLDEGLTGSRASRKRFVSKLITGKEYSPAINQNYNSFRNMANRERTNLVTENNQFLGAGIIATITSTVFNTVKSVIKMLFAW